MKTLLQLPSNTAIKHTCECVCITVSAYSRVLIKHKMIPEMPLPDEFIDLYSKQPIRPIFDIYQPSMIQSLIATESSFPPTFRSDIALPQFTECTCKQFCKNAKPIMVALTPSGSIADRRQLKAGKSTALSSRIGSLLNTFNIELSLPTVLIQPA
uniref:Uncharacterized protein n=1 Tax=Ascaris lumbricoides TaxID=6252 RepID=A0A0M3IUC3_ASCLU